MPLTTYHRSRKESLNYAKSVKTLIPKAMVSYESPNEGTNREH